MPRAPKSPAYGPRFEDLQIARAAANPNGPYAAVRLPKGPLDPLVAASLARAGHIRI